MDIEYRKCTIEHMRLIAPQEGDKYNQLMYVTPEYADILADNFSLSAWDGSKCIGAAGIIYINKFRSIAWALLGRDSGKHMLTLTRKVREIIHSHPSPRIEILVDYDFKEGHRWAKLMGFEVEAPRMQKHGFFGNDETLYARIKPCQC